MIFLSLSLFI